MKTYTPILLVKPLTLLIIGIVLASALATAPSQTPISAPNSAPTPVSEPKLTPEQRRDFAELQKNIMADPEYTAAVKRAIEAQKIADSVFFAKMAKSAPPSLQEYIKFLAQARSVQRPSGQ